MGITLLPDGNIRFDSKADYDGWAASTAAQIATAPAAPAAPAPASTVRVNPVNRLPATDATPCDVCKMKCGVAAKCQCIDFDVPNHTRKFATDMRKSKAGNDYTALSAHQRSSCYGRKVAPYQIQAMVQTLSHNGWESRYVGGKPAPVNNPFGGTATTDHEALATNVVPVPGGANRTTRDGFPMCRATNQTGKRIGELCTTKIWVDAKADPLSGTCRRHQKTEHWVALGSYVADPITPPYSQDAIPEIAPQIAGTGDEATGAQTADVAGTTGAPAPVTQATLDEAMQTIAALMNKLQPGIDGLS